MQEDVEVQREERAIYAIMLAACAPIVIALAVQHQTIDGGNALILIVVVLGALGLFAAVRAMRRVSLPRARVLRRRSP